MHTTAVHYPYSRHNPYQTLLFAACLRAGASCQALEGGVVSLLKYVVKPAGSQVLHLHWIGEPVAVPSPSGALARMCLFQLALLIWRARGRQVVWTVHNLQDHDRKHPWLDRLNGMLVGRQAKTLIVHGAAALQAVGQAFHVPPSKLRVVAHGNYVQMAPCQAVDTGHAGTRFLFFGQIRPYKGVVPLLQAFRGVAGAHELRIAGKLDDPALESALQTGLARDHRVALRAGFQTDDQLSDLLSWCDVVVLPYVDVLTSGSQLLAMSAGRATIAPQTGLMAEYADPDVDFLYDPLQPDGLQSALVRATLAGDLPRRGASARARASRFGWEAIGRQTAAIYAQACGTQVPGTGHDR